MKIPTKLAPLAVLLLLAVAVLSGTASADQPHHPAMVPGRAPDGPGDVASPAVGSVSVDPAASTVTLGDTVMVDVVVEGATDLRGFEFDLGYDAAVVQIVDVELGDLLENWAYDFLLLDDVDNTAGTATIAAIPAENNPGPTGGGVLATITVEGVALGNSPLDLYDVTVWDPDAQDIAAPGDGTVEVQEPGACVAPQITGLDSDSPVTLGEMMNFDATVTGTAPFTYTWDFDNDGVPEESGVGLDTTSYMYGAAGDYTVALTVENACGTDDETLDVTVQAGACVPAHIVSLVSNSPVEEGQAMTFNAVVTGDPPITYNWDFGGGGTATGENTASPTFTYDRAGTYTVTLSVENACGQDEETLQVTVEEAVCVPPTIQMLGADTPGEAGEPMDFVAMVDGSEPLTYIWDFGGDGTAEDEDTAAPTFTYDDVGDYVVTLTVENACGEDEETLNVRVDEPCDLEILELASDSPVALGDPMQFTALVTGTEPIDYTWLFGDGEEQSGVDLDAVSHTYDAVDTYFVTLIVENFCGTEQATLTVKVVEQPLLVWIEPEMSSVYEGSVFTVDVMVDGVEDLAGYGFSVAFDPDIVEVDGVADGGFLGSTGRDPLPLPPDIDNEAGLLKFAAVSTGMDPGPNDEGRLAVITLEAVGPGISDLDLHEVMLFDTGGLGHEPTTVDDGTVEVSDCIAVTITDLTSSSPVELGEAMAFTAAVTGTAPYTYTWDFDGAGTATDEDTATPTFTYDAAGTYSVMLTVENSCGWDADSLLVEVTVEYDIFLPIVTKDYTP
jgi:PKD repeat protein